jgi:hypothetical protein
MILGFLPNNHQQKAPPEPTPSRSDPNGKPSFDNLSTIMNFGSFGNALPEFTARWLLFYHQPNGIIAQRD